jgi:hypothetical protein
MSIVRDIEDAEFRQTATRHILNFEIQYPTAYGQYLAVIGNGETLGCWTLANKKTMNWNPGNIWTLQLDCKEVADHFEYKYLLCNSEEAIWEPGANRFAYPANAVIDGGKLVYSLKDTWKV